jgi:peroxiredoxin
MKTTKMLFAALIAGGLALSLPMGVAQADDKGKEKGTEKVKDDSKKGETTEVAEKGDKAKKDKSDKSKKDKAGKGVTTGDTAPNFSLTDTAGNSVELASFLKDGSNIVVLQWFNPDCPFVKMHYQDTKTFNDLHAKYKDKGVVFLAINSGAAGKQGAGLDRNKKAVTDWNIAYPVLMDESGDVGRAYNAKTTPEMFVIGKDGVIAYHGAIDDAKGTDGPGKNNYVAKALDEVLAGTSVTKAKTEPYGCKVKY